MDRNWLKKFMQVGADVTYSTPISVSVTTPVSEILLPFKKGQISLLGHGV